MTDKKKTVCRLIRYIEGMRSLMGAPTSLKDCRTPNKQELDKLIDLYQKSNYV